MQCGFKVKCSPTMSVFRLENSHKIRIYACLTVGITLNDN